MTGHLCLIQRFVLIFSVGAIIGARLTQELQPIYVVTFLLGDINNTVRNISIPIKDDSLFEDAEKFFVVLNSNDSVKVLPPATATVYILNNDRKLRVD